MQFDRWVGFPCTGYLCPCQSHPSLHTHPPLWPTALSEYQPHRQVMNRNEEEEKVGINSHQAPNAHDRPHAGNSVFPTHIIISSRPPHPISTPTFPLPILLLLLRSNKAQKRPQTHRIRHDPHPFPFPTSHPPSASPLRPSPPKKNTIHSQQLSPLEITRHAPHKPQQRNRRHEKREIRFQNPQDRRRGPHEHQPRILLSGLFCTTITLGLDFHLLRRR